MAICQLALKAGLG